MPTPASNASAPTVTPASQPASQPPTSSSFATANQLLCDLSHIANCHSKYLGTFRAFPLSRLLHKPLQPASASSSLFQTSFLSFLSFNTLKSKSIKVLLRKLRFACSSHRGKAKTLLFPTRIFHINNPHADAHEAVGLALFFFSTNRILLCLVGFLFRLDVQNSVI